MYRQGGNVQLMIPRMGLAVKGILIASVVMFILQYAGERWFGIPVSALLGYMPQLLLKGWVWQPLTYAFLHAGVFHLVFNLLIVWSIGSELELAWGSKFFLLYFFGCTVGAAATWSVFAAFGIGGALDISLVGSSGAVYGMLLAYGILFGDRLLYFFMIFPMRARYFVMILGGIVLFATVFNTEQGVAHTAHLGGMIVGMAMLVIATAWRRRARPGPQKIAEKRKKRVDKATHLRLVKEKNEGEDSGGTPNIWH